MPTSTLLAGDATAAQVPVQPQVRRRRTVEPFSLVLFGCLLVVFVGLVVPPIFMLGKIALTDADTGAPTLGNFADIIRD
jgi:hypothetical protein